MMDGVIADSTKHTAADNNEKCLLGHVLKTANLADIDTVPKNLLSHVSHARLLPEDDEYLTPPYDQILDEKGGWLRSYRLIPMCNNDSNYYGSDDAVAGVIEQDYRAVYDASIGVWHLEGAGFDVSKGDEQVKNASANKPHQDRAAEEKHELSLLGPVQAPIIPTRKIQLKKTGESTIIPSKDIEPANVKPIFDVTDYQQQADKPLKNEVPAIDSINKGEESETKADIPASNVEFEENVNGEKPAVDPADCSPGSQKVNISTSDTVNCDRYSARNAGKPVSDGTGGFQELQKDDKLISLTSKASEDVGPDEQPPTNTRDLSFAPDSLECSTAPIVEPNYVDANKVSWETRLETMRALAISTDHGDRENIDDDDSDNDDDNDDSLSEERNNKTTARWVMAETPHCSLNESDIVKGNRPRKYFESGNSVNGCFSVGASSGRFSSGIFNDSGGEGFVLPQMAMQVRETANSSARQHWLATLRDIGDTSSEDEVENCDMPDAKKIYDHEDKQSRPTTSTNLTSLVSLPRKERRRSNHCSLDRTAGAWFGEGEAEAVAPRGHHNRCQWVTLAPASPSPPVNTDLTAGAAAGLSFEADSKEDTKDNSVVVRDKKAEHNTGFRDHKSEHKVNCDAKTKDFDSYSGEHKESENSKLRSDSAFLSDNIVTEAVLRSRPFPSRTAEPKKQTPKVHDKGPEDGWPFPASSIGHSSSTSSHTSHTPPLSSLACSNYSTASIKPASHHGP